MKNHYAASVLFVAVSWLGLGRAEAQQCSKFQVSAAVGDASTPLPTDGVQILLNCPSCNAGNFLLPGSLSFGWSAGTYQVQVYQASNYFIVPYRPLGTCTYNADLGCSDCAGSVSVSMFATRGNIDGTVTDCSSDSPVSGATVLAAVPPSQGVHALTDASGYFNWKAPNTAANEWGVTVANTSNGTGPGSSTYTVDVVASQGTSLGPVQATVTSSNLATVALFIKNPAVREPGRCKPRVLPTRGGGPSAPEAPHNAGQPVNVVTGNVWFDRTDATVPVDGSVLAMVRSYNSTLKDVYGVFGRGWSHSLERRLNLAHPQAAQRVIEFIEPDGSRQYYHDKDQDQIYIASYPRSNQHWITASGGNYIRQFQGGGSETYNSSGLLLQETDAQGRSITYTYSGSLVASVSASGRTLTFGYTSYFGNSRLTSVKGPDGETLVSYLYGPPSSNTFHLLQRVEYSDGTGYVFSYHPSSAALVGVADLEGRWIERHEYDATGRGTTSEIADGVEKYSFAYAPGLTTVTDALGRATTYEWKLIGTLKRVTRVTGPCSGCGGGGGSDVREWGYDSQSRVVTYTDAEGGMTTYTYASETSDDIVSVQFSKPTASPAYTEPATTYEYQNGFLWKVTAPDGAVTEYERNAAGDVTKVIDPLLRETTMSYSSGRLSTITDPRLKATLMGYDAVTGDLLTVTDPLSHTTTFTYDNQGRRKTVSDALNHITTTTYSAGGRVTRVTNHDATYTQFKYEKGGRRSEVIDPMGRSTRYQYDLYGRLIAVIDPMNGVTKHGYDLMSNLISLTDAKNQTTSFEFNGHNQVTRTIYPGGAFETFTYDTLSRLVTMTDRKGIVTTYTYDAKSRLIGKTFTDATPPFSYTYDIAGRMLTAANGTDTLTWSYNLAGELLSEQSAKNASTVAYQYDDGGNRIEVKLDGTVFVTYAYDDASRLTTIARGANIFGFAYDNANRRTAMSYPNGVDTAYTYDNLNRLTNLAATKTSTSTPITNFGYQYDAAGNRTQKSTLDFTEDYGYDPLYRLTRSERTPSPAVIASGGPLAVPRSNLWTYDAVGNRLSNQDNESVTTSTHNEKNQLLNSTGGGKMLWRGTLDEPGIATFSAPTINGQPARMLAGNVFEATLDLPAGANNVTIQAQDGSGNVATKVYSVNVIGVPSSYTYDANGNLAAKTEGADSWTYTWNALNQLTAVTKNAVSQATYSYDPMGRRVERLAGVTGTVWTYDQEDLLREGAAAAAVVTTTRFIHGPAIDEPMAQENASTAAVTYLHADALGSITRQTDAAGSAGGAITYDPWGKIQSGVPTLHAFTAREWDPAVQMHFYRARWYDQAQGRFASEDPVRFAAGVNFYTYTIGNPVRYEDPFGLDINVCFYADAAARAGHVGYGLPGEAGTEGFYSKRGVPFGDGAIKPDEQKEKTCKVIPAKPWQDDCMRSCRERRAKTPGKYNILSRQCTGFVRECLLECNLPSGDPYLIPPKDYFDTLPPPPPAPSKGK